MGRLAGLPLLVLQTCKAAEQEPRPPGDGPLKRTTGSKAGLSIYLNLGGIYREYWRNLCKFHLTSEHLNAYVYGMQVPGNG